MSSVIREATEKDNKTRLSTSEDDTFFIIKNTPRWRAEHISLQVAGNLTTQSGDEGTEIFILIRSSLEERKTPQKTGGPN